FDTSLDCPPIKFSLLFSMSAYMLSLAFHPHAKIPLEKLMLSDEQRHAIQEIYESEQELSLKYFSADESQDQVQELLASNQLDLLSRKQLENRWNVQWSTSWPSGGRICRRTLFQW
ncbi:hypothetical protein B0H16DRAFT_1231928, partial [Mycena metata]